MNFRNPILAPEYLLIVFRRSSFYVSTRRPYNHRPMSGIKHDASKPRLDLLPFVALTHVAEVLGHGAERYGPHNWRSGIETSRLLAAALRHIFAYARHDRFDYDDDTGFHHLAHAICELLFILENDLTNTAIDDRYTQPVKSSAGAGGS